MIVLLIDIYLSKVLKFGVNYNNFGALNGIIYEQNLFLKPAGESVHYCIVCMQFSGACCE